jgi:hypothetical protein
MVCQACHIAKVKCSTQSITSKTTAKTSTTSDTTNEEPCPRCIRLRILCVPHESRQGKKQRKKDVDAAAAVTATDTGVGQLLALKRKRTVDTDDDDDDDDDNNNNNYCLEGQDQQQPPQPHVKDLVVEKTVLSHFKRHGENHYGLHAILRQWVSFAMTRRSFGLLAKASALAKKACITMDQILCAQGCPREWWVNTSGSTTTTSTFIPRPMDFLPAIALIPSNEQIVCGPPLDFYEIPEALRLATYCSKHARDRNCYLGDRWITVKQMLCGINRFFASDAFEREVCSVDLMQTTWKANQQSVTGLYMTEASRKAYGDGLAQQISLHILPNTPPAPIRLPTATDIQLKSGVVVSCHCVMCWHVVTLDLSYMFQELIPVRTTQIEPIPIKSTTKATEIDVLSKWPEDTVGEPNLLDNIAFLDWSSDLDEWMQELGTED